MAKRLTDAWEKIEVLLYRVGANEKEITKVKNLIENNYVTKQQYEPLRNIIYGMVGLILMTVLTALLNKVL